MSSCTAAITSTLIAMVAANPEYIGCDLKKAGGANMGENIMTCAQIMGKAPVEDAVAAADKTEVEANGKVTITLTADFVGGIAHAQAGTFRKPDWTSKPLPKACEGTASMLNKVGGTDRTLEWTAPDTMIGDVVLSFVGSNGVKTVRNSIIIRQKPASSTSGALGIVRLHPITAAICVFAVASIV